MFSMIFATDNIAVPTNHAERFLLANSTARPATSSMR